MAEIIEIKAPSSISTSQQQMFCDSCCEKAAASIETCNCSEGSENTKHELTFKDQEKFCNDTNGKLIDSMTVVKSSQNQSLLSNTCNANGPCKVVSDITEELKELKPTVKQNISCYENDKVTEKFTVTECPQCGKTQQQQQQSVCRICYGNDDEEELLAPCKCLGTVQFIHESCLLTWLKSGATQCELCKANYRFHRMLRPYQEVSYYILNGFFNDIRIYIYTVNSKGLIFAL